jgi:hypothetical protein
MPISYFCTTHMKQHSHATLPSLGDVTSRCSLCLAAGIGCINEGGNAGMVRNHVNSQDDYEKDTRGASRDM